MDGGEREKKEWGVVREREKKNTLDKKKRKKGMLFFFGCVARKQ
jgi:hypothetical protein